MRRWLSGVAILLGAPVWAAASDGCPAEAADRVFLGEQRIQVEVAATPEARRHGLSGRETLAPGRGMWFVMPEPTWGGFWMRDMRFPLDLIWADADARIIKVETLEPCDSGLCPIHYPPRPAAYVLELNAGTAQGRLGEKVRWKCPHQP